MYQSATPPQEVSGTACSFWPVDCSFLSAITNDDSRTEVREVLKSLFLCSNFEVDLEDVRDTGRCDVCDDGRPIVNGRGVFSRAVVLSLPTYTDLGDVDGDEEADGYTRGVYFFAYIGLSLVLFSNAPRKSFPRYEEDLELAP